jgi:nickel-dependent lactate racemase
MNFLDYFGNTNIHYIKKSMFEVLQERYSKNEQIIERVAASLITEKDTKDFLKLVTDIYEMAYLKSVKDHKEALQKVGLVATVKADHSKDG